jgi:glycine dehydrogenase subunit 1
MNFSGNEARIEEILDVMNLGSLEDLFKQIPKELRYPAIDLPDGMDERSIRQHFAALARKNAGLTGMANYSGGGHYFHYIPAAVDYVSSLGQFATAYTPYQAEVSQGTLQTLFEYQTYLTELTRMEVVNASHYDGSTAFAEALRMMYEANKKTGNTIVIANRINPEYREVAETYMQFTDADVVYADVFDPDFELPEKAAALSLFLPDYHGRVADVADLAVRAKERGMLLHIHGDPLLLSLITPPGDLGADVYTGEGQVLGIPVNFGGPYLGIFAVRGKLVRKMPGRLAGETTDDQDRRGFVLALSTREQHIRREKATSNICTNQGLMAVRAIAYMAALGRDGIKRVAKRCVSNAHYLIGKLNNLSGVTVEDPQALHFREMLITCDFPVDKLFSTGEKAGIIPGIQLDEHRLLISTTELQTRDQLDQLVELIGRGGNS